MLVPPAMMSAIPAIVAAGAMAIHVVMPMAVMPSMWLGLRLAAGATSAKDQSLRATAPIARWFFIVAVSHGWSASGCSAAV